MAKAAAGRKKTSTKKSSPAATTAAGASLSSMHGGRAPQGRRKERRPLDENKLTHVVLSSSEARGKLAFSTPMNRAAIKEILDERSAQFGVRVSSFESHGGHLHLLLAFKSREKFQGFLRTITAMIARRITGARKGHPFGRKFWDHLAFTRTIESADGAIEDYEEAATTAKKSRRSLHDILA